MHQAFDKRTGKQFWKVARDEKTSWSTPLLIGQLVGVMGNRSIIICIMVCIISMCFSII